MDTKDSEYSGETADFHQGESSSPPAAALGRMQRRVVCAAIRAADGEILLGIRHYSADMHRQIEQRRDGGKFRHRLDKDQGFVDQWGVFMDRFEAFQVADSAFQIARLSACGVGMHEGAVSDKLYSEGLY